MIRTKGEAGSGNIVEAVRHLRQVIGEIRALAALRPRSCATARQGARRAARAGAPRGARRPAAGAELRRRRHRHARRRRAVHGARRRGGVRRLGHLQERGPGGARPRDRARHHALGGARRRCSPRAAVSPARCPASRWRRSPSTSGSRTGAGERGRMRAARPRVGILAIQGDVEAHARALERVGAEPVRGAARARSSPTVDALILPGGESTTISKGLERLGLYEPIQAFARAGRPVLGTCAGRGAARPRGGEPPGAQPRRSSTWSRSATPTAPRSTRSPAPAEAAPCAGLRCVFIRAPRLRRPGPEVEVLARRRRLAGRGSARGR